jgi:hypothetical protein
MLIGNGGSLSRWAEQAGGSCLGTSIIGFGLSPSVMRAERAEIMLAQPQNARELQDRLEKLAGLIARYRRCLEQGASPKTAAAYQQAIHAAEAQIAEIERWIADLIPSEKAPPAPK